ADSSAVLGANPTISTGMALTASGNLVVGASGGATFSVSGGGNVQFNGASASHIGDLSTATSFVTVSGAGSRLAFPNATLAVANAGPGVLTVQSGASFSALSIVDSLVAGL